MESVQPANPRNHLMQILKTTSGGKEFHRKLKISDAEAIQKSLGVNFGDLLSADQPILKLMLSPLLMWQVTGVLIGDKFEETFKHRDLDEELDASAVLEWLEKMITDFYPTRSKGIVSAAFKKATELMEQPDEVIAMQQAQVEKVMEMLPMLEKLPELKSAMEGLKT